MSTGEIKFYNGNFMIPIKTVERIASKEMGGGAILDLGKYSKDKSNNNNTSEHCALTEKNMHTKRNVPDPDGVLRVRPREADQGDGGGSSDAERRRRVLHNHSHLSGQPHRSDQHFVQLRRVRLHIHCRRRRRHDCRLCVSMTCFCAFLKLGHTNVFRREKNALRFLLHLKA